MITRLAQQMMRVPLAGSFIPSLVAFHASQTAALHTGPAVVSVRAAPDGTLAVQRSAANVEIVDPASGRTFVQVPFSSLSGLSVQDLLSGPMPNGTLAVQRPAANADIVDPAHGAAPSCRCMRACRAYRIQMGIWIWN